MTGILKTGGIGRCGTPCRTPNFLFKNFILKLFFLVFFRKRQADGAIIQESCQLLLGFSNRLNHLTFAPPLEALEIGMELIAA